MSGFGFALAFTEEVYMKKLSTRQKIKYLLILSGILLIVLLAALYLYAQKNKNRTYLTYDVDQSVSLESNLSAGYGLTSDGVFRYSRDGASVIGAKGEEVWNVSFSMSNPIADTCGKCAVVADKDFKSLYIFDGTGSANPITTEYPIEKAVISAQGVVAVWMDDGTQDFFSLYSKDGQCLVDMNTLTATSGFPVDIAISNDGTKLITTYVEFEAENLKTQLTFYNFGDVGENYVDGLVGLEKFEGELLADVAFLNSNLCAAFGEKGFTLFSMDEIPEKITSVPISEEIESVSYSGKYIGVIVNSTSLGTDYVARIYDTKGKLVDERALSERYEHFEISGSEVILYSDLQLLIYRIGGAEKIQTAFPKNVNCIYSINEGDAYLLVGEQYAERIKLIGKKEE